MTIFDEGPNFFASGRIFWLIWPKSFAKSWQHCPLTCLAKFESVRLLFGWPESATSLHIFEFNKTFMGSNMIFVFVN
jgi:hypothetical protein